MNKRFYSACLALMLCMSLETQQPQSKTQGPQSNTFTVGIDIGISQTNRTQVTQQLNSLLSDEYILYTQTLNYHWNVVDPYFSAMHAFFKEQYEQLFDIVDRVAERVRALGEYAAGSFSEFDSYSRIKAQPGTTIPTRQMLENLLVNHEAIIRTIRLLVDTTQNEFNDSGTSNFLAEILVQHEKMAWMLRSSLSTK